MLGACGTSSVAEHARNRKFRSPAKKIWPHLWGHVFKRLRNWWAMSGKAIQGAVPPARTTFWEVTQKTFEGEGHQRVCGLFVTRGRSTCGAKTTIRRSLQSHAS